MSQPQLYRSPAKPGYLGGYNWPAVAVGLLVLVLANFFCTQYIANRFQYQPALGPPLLRLRAGAIYQPFAWVKWGWQHLTDRDPAIRTPFLLGMLVLVAGCFLSVGVFFAMTNRRARQLSMNAEHLHGSACWAEESDVRASGLLTANDGVFVGGWSTDGKRLHYLRHNGPEHILAFAPTRSGKGVGLVIPTLLAWSESAIVYDIKGENWAKTAGFRAQAGHVCFKFAPVEQQATSRFNPLSEVRLFTPRDVSDAQNIASMIVRTGEDSPQERYWQDASTSITTGMILHACYAAALEGRQASLADLSHLFTRPGSSFRDTLDELLNFEHDPGFQHQWRMPDGSLTATHPVVREKVQEMMDKEEKDFGGVLSTAKTALTLYSDPLVANNISASDFTIDDLVNHQRPVSLYLVVPPSDKIRLRPLIRLILTMTVNRLTERTFVRWRRTAVQPPSAAVTHRRISVTEPHGDLRGRAVLHGGVRSEGLPHHPGHPANRGRLRQQREHRLQLPCAHRLRPQPIRNRQTDQRHDGHHHSAESHLQFQRPAPFAGHGAPECFGGQH